MTDYNKEQKVNYILVDGGSTVTIMLKSAVNDLHNTVTKLAKSRIMIQGFNLGGQCTIGMIDVELTMSDLSTSSILCVIDAKTPYKLLLGRSWLHEHRIMGYTLHQCLKYYEGGEKKIKSNIKQFTRVKSHFCRRKGNLKRVMHLRRPCRLSFLL